MENKALLLGCGNIGSGYDLDDQGGRVWTHARALHINGIPTDVYDKDQSIARTIASRYNFRALNIIPSLEAYSLVCIATPTPTHSSLLEQCFKAETPVVICEKPVSLKGSDLKTLATLKESCRSKVLVNYMRRFQPQYRELKEVIRTGYMGDFTGAAITYCRGFLNNCSHAFDLMEYLLGTSIELGSFSKVAFSHDVFEDDPTLSGQFLYKSAPVHVLGLTYVDYRIFEMKLFFTGGMIEIISGGDTVRYHRLISPGNLVLEKSVERILHTYMLPVYEHARTLLENRETLDNFNLALRLNQEMLTVLNK